MFITPLVSWLRKFGVVHANPDNAVKALESGGVVGGLPGGDYDACRPALKRNVIDFRGPHLVASGRRRGPACRSCRSAYRSGPGTQWFLAAATGLARRLGLPASGWTSCR